MTDIDVKVNDVSVSDLLNITVEKSITRYTGAFKFEVENYEGDKTDDYNFGDDVKIYLDSTLVIRGRVEDIDPQHQELETIVLKGKDYTARLLDRVVNESFTDTNIKTIVESLVNEYTPELTTTNVNEPGQNWTGNFKQKRLLYALQELADLVNYQVYVDASKDVHFEPKSQTHSGYTLSVTTGNISSYDFPELGKKVANRTWVYGAWGVAVMREDKTSQSELNFIKDKVIVDPTLSLERARSRAAAELAQWKAPLMVGEISSWGMFDLEPGQLVTVTIPDLNINSEDFIVLETNFSLPPQSTKIKVAEWRAGFQETLSDLMKKQEEHDIIEADLAATVEWWNSLSDTMKITHKCTVWVRDATDAFLIGKAVIGQAAIGDRRGSWTKWYEG